MLILRKYRIIPVGWELAAQKIQSMYAGNNLAQGQTLTVLNNSVPQRPSGISLKDMLACYAQNDDITGYYSDWCAGLVDPYWVLKLPDYYCAARGFGAYLQQDPSSRETGTRYCSSDAGKTVAKVDGQEVSCIMADDCCTEGELTTKQNRKDFKCLADCTYVQRQLVVDRTSDYCGDERSCIKTGNDGSCQFYGYCTKERRGWLFSQNKSDTECAPLSNTCTAYRSATGKAVYLLANTLDFAQCDESNVGCTRYATTGNYTANVDKIDWVANNSIFLDKSVVTCRNNEEGCHQFIRFNDDLGTNLIGDGSFEAVDTKRWSASGAVAIKGQTGVVTYQGLGSLNLGSRGVYYGPSDSSLIPAGFNFDLDRLYTLSAYVYVVSGQAEVGIGKSGTSQAEKLFSTTVNSWEQFTLTVNNNFELNADSFWIKPSAGSEVYVDNIKFEVGVASNYTEYGSNNLSYLKLLPSYLEKACYVNPPVDYNLRPDAPTVCAKFVRRCSKDEVGCQLFIDVKNQDKIAAKTKPKDVCPKECVGFDTYIQRANTFYEAREEHFIPATTKTCRPQATGCSLFVNLDRVKEGGEENEYYASLRQCMAKSEDCGEFYTWEGSAETGFQLVVYSLKANQSTKGILDQPATLDDDNTGDSIDTGLCDSTIFALAPDSPDYNPDCRQFYGKDGHVSYHSYKKTVSCADNCHPYRIANPNVSSQISNVSECTAADGHWRSDTLDCVVCRGGGVWQDEHQSCIYMAIPGEGVKCSAAEAGCSEYVGNFGNKLRILFNDTFEKGLNNWGPSTDQVTVASEAVVQGGHSLQTSGNFLVKNVSGVKISKKYELSFLAKTNTPNLSISDISFNAGSLTADNLMFGKNISLTADWQVYKFAISEITRDDLDSLVIRFSDNASGVYLDNLKLLEADDRYYLIKDSWVTPESCNQDHQGNPFPLYMLGCRQYKDGNGQDRFLRSFDALCQSSGVGCEALLDTHNSKNFGAQIFNDTNKDGLCNEPDCVNVPADNVTYVVYDEAKKCDSAKKGCQRLGAYNEEKLAYKDGYWLNNPDTYAENLCKTVDVGCVDWLDSNGGKTYFKDPGNKLCEFRQVDNNSDWYQKRLSYCFAEAVFASEDICKQACPESDTQICRQDDKAGWHCASQGTCSNKADCTSNNQCLLTGSNVKCTLDTDYVDADGNPKQYLQKTVGLGVVADKSQPVGMKADGWAGACGQAQDTCTEYIDPESRISYNLIARDTTIKLDYDKLYILKAGNVGSANITCPNQELQVLGADNLLRAVSNTVTTPQYYSEEFYIRSPRVASASSVACTVGGNYAELKEAIVSYRLKKTLGTERPNEIDFVKGQILFNERSFVNGVIQNVVYHTAASPDNSAPKAGETPPGNNANILLKVDPDRSCSEWLGCKSYGINPLNDKEKICYERAVCDRLNDAGECVNFLDKEAQNQIYPTPLNDIANLSGYSKVGYNGNNLEAGLYPLGAMTEYGDGLVKFDGSFETKFNTGFYNVNSDGKTNSAMAPVIRDIAVIQKELGYGSYKQVPDGQAIGKTTGCVEREIDGVAGLNYVASAYIFIPFGAQATISIGGSTIGNCPLSQGCNNGFAVIATTNKVSQWVRLSGNFQIKDGYNDTKIKLRLCAKGSMYFDDVRIASGLHVSDNQYLHPSCRLYPERDSLSCDYFNDSGLRKKGWEGYCLEYDPRNPSVCLLWYPLDKVSSEEFEEGAALDIPSDLYYCIDAEDQCRAENLVEPEFACKTFIKVDKNKYWYSRILSGSSYNIPRGLLTGLFGPETAIKQSKIDFGVDGKNKPGGYKNFDLNQSAGSGYYGAYLSKTELADKQATMGITGSKTDKRLYPFVPYFGTSLGGKDVGDPNRNALCMATIDDQKRDKPYILGNDEGNGGNVSSEKASIGPYDDCFIRMQGDNYDDGADRNCGSGFDQCCNWDADLQKCSGFRGAMYSCTNGSKLPDPPYMTCLSKACVNEYGDDMCKNKNTPRGSFRFTSMPYRYAMPPVAGDLGTNCTIWKDDKGMMLFTVSDVSNNNGNPVCLFDCVNHTKSFYVSDNKDRAVYAVNRLFTNVDSTSCYRWNNGAYVPDANCPEVQSSFQKPDDQYFKACNGPRPVFNNNNSTADLCYISPVVDGVKINLPKVGADSAQQYVLHSRGWVQISFNSHIDQEQLPLREYTINWGYNGRKMVRSANMFERPDQTKPHIALHFYDYTKIDNSYIGACGTADNPGKLIRPAVTVKDNWGMSSNPTTAQSSTDFPICVLLK
ncbi:hypothetical protein COT94_03240 [Candidatus Falkowbacteria bacterium CG10_big_fil_rev_8_21_14_0_10_37_14]|uniref:CBM-cenC domain-containing protein n=1 Tax=Candidatus Falkowbacteria bacterium CG10_big_fil_rev_8_21_14_0_10_37_14 TaxID=1974561 RepID=A0A2M6WT10_9BACT|nr:MAG: hypothetical protein COT94_03240 [Candidatus Falkowbacteria bacterium CG10_big_fil_rev_8_21_14_0_10_37_14]